MCKKNPALGGIAFALTCFAELESLHLKYNLTKYERSRQPKIRLILRAILSVARKRGYIH